MIIHFSIQMNILTLERKIFSPLRNYIYLDIWQNNAGLRVLYDFTFFLWTTNNEIENFKWNVDAIHFAENLKINFPIF